MQIAARDACNLEAQRQAAAASMQAQILVELANVHDRQLSAESHTAALLKQIKVKILLWKKTTPHHNDAC